MNLLKLPNFYAIGLAVVVVVLIVVGIFNAGARHNEAKHEKATVATNKVIVEARGKDEAELDAEAKAAETVDASVKANLKQTLILNEGTAKLLGSVK